MSISVESIAVHASAKETTPELSLSASPFLHHAAVRYYEEAGFEVPDRLKQQVLSNIT
ncbi:MAG: hypothetical protein R2880_05015 [Deinococcales bacterium]